jgi:hypothetical protein
MGVDQHTRALATNGRCRPENAMGEQGVQKIMGYSNHFVMAITSAEVKV